MVSTARLKKTGGSVRTTIPKHMLEAAGLGEGDTVYFRVVGGEIIISRFDPDFERAMEAYKLVDARYGNALRELAK